MGQDADTEVPAEVKVERILCLQRPMVALLVTLVIILVAVCTVLGTVLITQTGLPDAAKEISTELSSTDGLPASLQQDECSRVCLTEDCVTAAAAILKLMDRSVDPCDDFYEYACGKWLRHHPLPDDKAAYDTFSQLRQDLQTVLKTVLESPVTEKDSNATRNVKNLYRSCTNISLIEKRGEVPLSDLLKLLGGWPIVDTSWDESKGDITELLGKLKQYNNDVLMAVWIGADTKNSSVHIIQIDQPNLGVPSRDYLLRKGDKVSDAYLAFMKATTKLMGASEDGAENETKEMLAFEVELANITRPSELRRNYTELYRKMTVGELNENVPQIEWMRFMSVLSPTNITDSEPLAVFALDYLKDLGKLLEKTPKRVVANYALWRFVQHRTANLDNRFLNLRQDYFQVLHGRQRLPERWRECVSYVNGNMGMAVGALFVRDNFNDRSKSIAESMIAAIREAFVELLDEVDWMDPVTKLVARDKAHSVNEKIGYPEYILDPVKLDRDYIGLDFHPETYFENVLKNLRHLSKTEQERLRLPVNRTLWSTTPAVVNAFYSRTKNQILFPAGILQPPFYHQNYPKSLNYGGIGVVIGHELTHGFDDKGRQFDHEGNLKQWWAEDAVLRFHEKAQCIIDQYSNYTIPELGLQLNGINTQGENIADNGGIKQSFRAYRKWVATNGDEPALPGINLTHNQLFFLNYAQVWCGVMRPEAAITKVKTGPHSPGRFRVIGALSNSYDFAEAYQCATGSRMNPEHKCSVW